MSRLETLPFIFLKSTGRETFNSKKPIPKAHSDIIVASGQVLCVLVTQSCLTLWDPMDCSSPGSPVHGILQARILEWVAIPFSRGSSQPRDRTWVSRGFFTVWTTREAGYWSLKWDSAPTFKDACSIYGILVQIRKGCLSHQAYGPKVHACLAHTKFARLSLHFWPVLLWAPWVLAPFQPHLTDNSPSGSLSSGHTALFPVPWTSWSPFLPHVLCTCFSLPLECFKAKLIKQCPVGHFWRTDTLVGLQNVF